MLIVLAGLPEPQVNEIFLKADGSWWIGFDLYYAAYTVLVEYDGRQHAEDTPQWQHDITRRETLDTMGIRLLIITKDDLYGSPEQVLVRYGMCWSSAAPRHSPELPTGVAGALPSAVARPDAHVVAPSGAKREHPAARSPCCDLPVRNVAPRAQSPPL